MIAVSLQEEEEKERRRKKKEEEEEEKQEDDKGMVCSFNHEYSFKRNISIKSSAFDSQHFQPGD